MCVPSTSVFQIIAIVSSQFYVISRLVKRFFGVEIARPQVPQHEAVIHPHFQVLLPC